MKKEFWIKKDPNIDGQDNWKRLSSFEYARFIETEEGKVRKKNIVKVPGNEYGRAVTYMEVDSKTAKEWKKENNREYYMLKSLEKSGFEIDSYNVSIHVGDEALYGEELLMDENCDVEAAALHLIDLGSLRSAIGKLGKQEQKLINLMLESGMRISLVDISEQMQLTYEQVRYLVESAYTNIRKNMN